MGNSEMLTHVVFPAPYELNNTWEDIFKHSVSTQSEIKS